MMAPAGLRATRDVGAEVHTVTYAAEVRSGASQRPPRALRVAIGDRDVPKSIRIPYVRALVEAFLSNGNGIAQTADPMYAEMITRFGRHEAEIALLMFGDQLISSRLSWPLCQQKWGELLHVLGPKISTPQARTLFGAVNGFTGKPDKLALDTDMQRLGKAAADQLRADGVI